jgi:hypothetical protein
MNDYLYHGTSSAYLINLYRDGLTGMYPDKIYKSLKLFLELSDPKVKEIHESIFTYILSFIERQEYIRQKPTDIAIYLAKLDSRRICES